MRWQPPQFVPARHRSPTEGTSSAPDSTAARTAESFTASQWQTINQSSVCVSAPGDGAGWRFGLEVRLPLLRAPVKKVVRPRIGL